MAEIQSILTSVKQTLGLAEDYEVFDQDILIHINSVLGTLNQIGVGPEGGLGVWDKSVTWLQLLGGDPLLNMAKSYIYLRVRLLFDSDSLTGPVINQIEAQIKEMEWRLNVQTDPYVPDPNFPDEDDDPIIIDGGGP